MGSAIKLSGASDVATRSAETNDQAEAHRIAGSRKHNGNGRACRPSGQRSGRTGCGDHRDLAANEVGQSGKRSYWPSAQRYSIVMFWPSV